MISSETARDVALAYREIEVAEKLLAQISEAMSRRSPPDIRDAFGRQVGGLQLGVPSGEGGQRLFDVPWEIARPVIETHIAQKKAVIASLSAKARIELGEATAQPPASTPAGTSTAPSDARRDDAPPTTTNPQSHN